VSVKEQAKSSWVPDVLTDSVMGGVLTGRRDRLSRRLVWVVLVVLFAGGWGQGLLTAVLFLAGHDPRDPHPSVSRVWSQGVEGFSQAALLVVAVVLAVRWAGVPLSAVGLRLPRTRGDWLGEVTGAGWGVLLTVVSFSLVTTAYPSIPGQNAEILDALTGWLAGPSEEMVFIVAAVVLLRRAQYSWTLVVLVSAVARVSFHIYYGPTSVFILLWAVGVVLLYRATGRVLGIIAAHAMWDLYAALAVLPWWWCTAASFILVVALSLVAAAAIMVPLTCRYMTRDPALDPNVAGSLPRATV
jgi:hypothetical protein